MGKRILLAGVLGGLAVFLWGALSHMALGLGEAGMKSLPPATAVVESLRSSLPDAGMYFFVPTNAGSGAGMQNQAAAPEQKAAAGPEVLLIYHPVAVTSMGRQLSIELALNIVQALIAVWLLSALGITGFGRQVGFVLAIGFLAAITTNIEYWNWYRFPATYTAAYMLEKMVGFLLIGLIAAALGRKAPARPELVSAKAA